MSLSSPLENELCMAKEGMHGVGMYSAGMHDVGVNDVSV
jgi:hypothetical protein